MKVVKAGAAAEYMAPCPAIDAQKHFRGNVKGMSQASNIEWCHIPMKKQE